MAAQRILLFGDQTDAPVPMIRRLVEKSRHSSNLRSFLRSSMDAVQLEVAKLTPMERDTVGSFHSIQDLAESYNTASDRYGIAQMTLVFVARIGEIILHAERDPSLLTSSDTRSTPVIAFGICGGLLSAAATAVATTVSELIEVATFLAGTAVRVGVATARRSLQIEDDTGSWAFSALGTIVAQVPPILDQYHRNQAIPRHRQAYVGISADGWVTVFGPPSVLKGLVESSEALRQSGVTVLPLFGAVHAPHLVLPDIADLMGESPCLDKPIKANFRLISGSKYTPLLCSDLRELMQECLMDIFQCPLNLTRLFKTTGSVLDKTKQTSLLIPGATSYQPLLRRALHAQSFSVTLNTNAPTQATSEMRGGSESVAIVGMSGRFPGSDSVDGLWETIMAREEFHTKIPEDRFDVDVYFDETGQKKNAITTAWGCFLEQPGLFDYKMFNVSPREAVHMDPGQRLLMHATYEALEDAGVATNGTLSTDNKRISTFVGDCMDDWREIQPPMGVDIYMVQGTQRAFTPGRINHHFKWEGATLSLDSACGSSASAVGMAYRSLINRHCDTAVAGGANIIATPFWQSAMSKGGFLSPTGSCKTFREDADGYCRAEAVGVMVLKRLEDAIADNDRIDAVITGYARNHSAETVSITRPHCQTQERVYKGALHDAGLQPHDISFVEAHGTGTTAGDGAELESIASVFGQPDSRESPVVVGAVKANIGHSEAASGITSLIKAAMVFRREVIPPQVGIPQKLGKYACLEHASVLVPGDAVPFSRQAVGRKRNVVVSNFDAAGGNSCFVLQEPPQPPIKEVDPREHYVVTCSGHSPKSFEENKRRLLRFLTQNSDSVNLADLAYTTTVRRMHHSLRAAYCGKSVQNIIDALGKDVDGEAPGRGQQKGTRPVAFLFTGQGAHYAGMGADLFKTSARFRATITTLQRVCDTHKFPSWVQLVAEPDTMMDTISTVQLHLALVALEMALVDLWRSWGVEPDLVIGHSIGEYAALYAAHVLSANDVMYLVGKRAELIQRYCIAGSHAMLSISGTADQVSTLLAAEGDLGSCEVACWNSPGMIVLSGERGDIKRLEGTLKERGFKCKLLEVPYAMHSAQMDAIIPEFRHVVRGLRFNSPRTKIVSTLLGELVAEDSNDVFDSEYLIRHTRQPVKSQHAIETCFSQQLADASAIWMELGPNPTCLGLLRSNASVSPANTLASLKASDNNWKTVSSVLAACYKSHKPLRWAEYHRDFIKCLSHLDLPKYAFDTKEFWVKWRWNDPGMVLENGSGQENRRQEPQLISTSLHRVLKQETSEQEQSATFTSSIAEPSLLQIIQGHKLSGIPLCPAGAYTDMAMTAARHLLTGGVWSAPYPSFSVLETQMDHPIVPTPESQKVVQVDVQRQNLLDSDFTVVFKDHANPASPTLGKCVVRIRDEHESSVERQTLLKSIEPRIARLVKGAGTGVASTIDKSIFYKLFSNLMTYSKVYEGVERAIVSHDFTEAVATVRIPPLDESRYDQRFTLSPYWMDALAHLTGFLLNGNPTISDDTVYIAMRVERMEMMGRDFSPDVSYQCYAYTERREGSDAYIAHVYMLHEGSIVGCMEGSHFRKMPRKTLHRVLGKPDPPQANAGKQSTKASSGQSVQVNGHSEMGAATTQPHTNGTMPNGASAEPQSASLVSVFREKLVEETGMTESELEPSTLFTEIGVDSLMSISILAALKAVTGVELSASFLLEQPTLEEAERGLRIIEKKNFTATNGVVNGDGLTNGTDEKDAEPAQHRDCNVVLMQGSAASFQSTPLFLIVDGAGSAAAYIHLPKLGDDLPVFAVESPWAQDPENFTCSFSEAADIYLAAIRAKQPHGPYMLGGWSAGGVFSYEVARRLLEAGEKVLGLIIIDISGPQYVDRAKVTPPTMAVIDQIGMLLGIDRNFDDASVQSARLKNHMLSTVTCFSKLDATPMRPGYQPDATFVIWATEELLPKTVKSNGVNGTSELNLDAWFYPSARGFSSDGWEELVGPKLESFTVEGDHFSMMAPPKVSQLGKVMREAIAKCAP